MPEETVDRERAELADAFRTFIHHGEALLGAKAEGAATTVADARSMLEGQLREAKTRLAELEKRVAEQTRAAARSTDEYVHENPWQSVGVAAGVGLVLGLLIGRR